MENLMFLIQMEPISARNAYGTNLPSNSHHRPDETEATTLIAIRPDPNILGHAPHMLGGKCGPDRLSARIAAILMEKAAELLTERHVFEKVGDLPLKPLR